MCIRDRSPGRALAGLFGRARLRRRGLRAGAASALFRPRRCCPRHGAVGDGRFGGLHAGGDAALAARVAGRGL